MLRGATQGLSGGVAGALAMFPVWFLFSWLRGRAWWENPNLLGSTFYGLRAFHSGAGMATLSGAALHFVLMGLVGIAFGILIEASGHKGRPVFWGIAAGLGSYFLLDSLVWRYWNPLIPAYMYAPGALTAHLIYGAFLGRVALPSSPPAMGQAVPPPDAVK